MNRNPRELTSRYLDDSLTDDEHRELEAWLKSSPNAAREFARASLLHNSLHVEMTAGPSPSFAAARSSPLQPRHRSKAVTTAAMIAVVVAIAAVWHGIGNAPASAASELERIIAAQAEDCDRTYRIDVEEATVEAPKREAQLNERRPPKPPLDGAMLSVRRGKQFVLVRQTSDGQPFVTGSNGRTSWAVRPDGPVRVSSDLARFNRDLPGHEHGMSLIHLEDDFEQLRSAYEIRSMPVEVAVDGALESTRLLVAVKKSGQRGPRRVEITYLARTGYIQQIRFVDMPYGPERLTLRLTLKGEQRLDERYFDHESHHQADRRIEEE